DNAFHFFGDVLASVFLEKDSDRIERTVNFFYKVQRFEIHTLPKPRYTLFFGKGGKIVGYLVKESINFARSFNGITLIIYIHHRASRSLLCDFLCCSSSLALYSLA